MGAEQHVQEPHRTPPPYVTVIAVYVFDVFGVFTVFDVLTVFTVFDVLNVMTVFTCIPRYLQLYHSRPFAFSLPVIHFPPRF